MAPRKYLPSFLLPSALHHSSDPPTGTRSSQATRRAPSGQPSRPEASSAAPGGVRTLGEFFADPESSFDGRPSTQSDSYLAETPRGHSPRSASVPLLVRPGPANPDKMAGRGPDQSPHKRRKSSLGRARSLAESEFFKPVADDEPDSLAPLDDGNKIRETKVTGSADDRNGPAGLDRREFQQAKSDDNVTPDTRGAGGGGGPQHDESHNTRVVHIGDPSRTNENLKLANNRVRTSKYTLFSFLPKNLFEQFHRLAYVYFLVIVILNQIPQLAVFGRTASLFPLLFVLIVTAIKDAYEDWGRHKADKEENNRLSLVLEDEGEFRLKPWKHMLVGEVVKLHSNEIVPCDLVLLGTSESNGVAYVETLNLDGESNLKLRYAPQETAAKHPESNPISGTLICELPNRNIYEFTAYMDMGGVHLPLGPKNILLRGCVVKNTSWVVGVAVYAGQETKAMLNSSGTQSKRSKLEKEMNRETLWLGFLLVVICLFGGIGMAQWVARHSDELDEIPYYRKKDVANGKNYRYYDVVGEGIIGFLSCVIVFQILIPISLYISMELVRLGQAYFMTKDLALYHEPSDSTFQCRALNLNEDLGQVKFVFSDKTGTLTENKMDFFAASINGVNYRNIRVVEFESAKLEEQPGGKGSVEDGSGKPAWKPEVGSKVDPNLCRVLQRPPGCEERQAVHEYFLVLAACNTIVPTRVTFSESTGQVLDMQAAGSGDGAVGKVEYHGESPDEQALVAAAAAHGFTLLERTSAHIIIDIMGEKQRFEVLGMHDFDSYRKRMSVIVRCPDGTVKLLMKGADSTMLDILENSQVQDVVGDKNQQSHVVVDKQQQSDVVGDKHQQSDIAGDKHQPSGLFHATTDHLDEYAREGLRTLVIATKVLEENDIQKWDIEYRRAQTAMADRAAVLQRAADTIERNLNLIGATGIEDKLQDGVPDTIEQLRKADIQVWVLTGDKQETAISIAISCLLITQEMQQIIINESSFDGCKEALAHAKAFYSIQDGSKKKSRRQRFWKTNQGSAVANGGVPGLSEALDGRRASSRRLSSPPPQPLALIIDGNSLVHCLTESLEQELFDVAVVCKVVVCCRVAPLQKAGIVNLVKRRTKETTLAIGDGANDVSMLQMAHVGIGISGQEGRQAVMASDFSMGQFRFLKKALLVHGHWNYSRLGYMVLYNFYRNGVFVLMLFWYIFYAAFSPQSALTDWNLVFYSLIYTSVPTIVVGILDKDLSQRTLLQHPGLYSYGQRNLGYSQALFLTMMLYTVWQSLVLFYVPYFTYRHSDVSMYGLGSLWTIAVVIVVNVHLALDVQHWTWIHHVAIWCSVAAAWICIFVMDSISSVEDLLNYYWESEHMATQWKYWFDIPLIVGIALLPRFCVKIFWQRYFPSDIHLAREAEIVGHSSSGTNEEGIELDEARHSPRLFLDRVIEELRSR